VTPYPEYLPARTPLGAPGLKPTLLCYYVVRKITYDTTLFPEDNIKIYDAVEVDFSLLNDNNHVCTNICGSKFFRWKTICREGICCSQRWIRTFSLYFWMLRTVE